MAGQETAPFKPVRISVRDVAAIVSQIFIAWALLDVPYHQEFYFAFAAYVGMVASLGLRAKKRGLTVIDRKAIVFGFFPIFIFAAYLSFQIWKSQYPLLFR